MPNHDGTVDVDDGEQHQAITIEPWDPEYPVAEDHVTAVVDAVETVLVSGSLSSQLTLAAYSRMAKPILMRVALFINVNSVLHSKLDKAHIAKSSFEDRSRFNEICELMPGNFAVMMRLLWKKNLSICNFFIKELTKIADNQRSYDYTKFSDHLPQLIEYSPEAERFTSYSPKTSRGFNHIDFAALLTPMQDRAKFLKDPEAYMASVHDGTTQITADSWPYFLYDGDEFDEQYPDIGIFKGPLLLQFLRFNLTGKSTTLGDKRASNKQSKAHLYGVEITPEVIAYHVVGLHWALSAARIWTAENDLVVYSRFYSNVVNLLNADDELCNEIVADVTEEIPGLKDKRSSKHGLRSANMPLERDIVNFTITNRKARLNREAIAAQKAAKAHKHAAQVKALSNVKASSGSAAKTTTSAITASASKTAAAAKTTPGAAARTAAKAPSGSKTVSAVKTAVAAKVAQPMLGATSRSNNPAGSSKKRHQGGKENKSPTPYVGDDVDDQEQSVEDEDEDEAPPPSKHRKTSISKIFDTESEEENLEDEFITFEPRTPQFAKTLQELREQDEDARRRQDSLVETQAIFDDDDIFASPSPVKSRSKRNHQLDTPGRSKEKAPSNPQPKALSKRTSGASVASTSSARPRNKYTAPPTNRKTRSGATPGCQGSFNRSNSHQ